MPPKAGLNTTPSKPTRIDQATNRRWLRAEMNPYFFTALGDEPEALAILERELDTLRFNRHIVLADREKSLIIATLNSPGSLYQDLATLSRAGDLLCHVCPLDEPGRRDGAHSGDSAF